MSTPTVEPENTAAEWRERLPVVARVVPEERDPFWTALPRALVIGAVVATVGGVLYAVLAVLAYRIDGVLREFWKNRELWALTDPVALLIAGGLAIAGSVLMFVVVKRIFARLGSTYNRQTYLRANNTPASVAGLVVAGVGMGLALLFLLFLAGEVRVLRLPSWEGEWADRLMYLVKAVGVIAVFLVGMMLMWQLHPRRHCSGCGGLLVHMRYAPISSLMAERLAAAVRRGSTAPLPDLSGNDPEADPDSLWVLLTLYRCEGCSARLIEGEMGVTLSEQENGREATADSDWLWLSVICSESAAGPLEATLPPLPLWLRLFGG